MEITNTSYDDSWYCTNDLFTSIDVGRRLGTIFLAGNRYSGMKFHDEDIELPIYFTWDRIKRQAMPLLDRDKIQPHILRRIDYQESCNYYQEQVDRHQ